MARSSSKRTPKISGTTKAATKAALKQRYTMYSRIHSPFHDKRNPFVNRMLNPYKKRKA